MNEKYTTTYEKTITKNKRKNGRKLQCKIEFSGDGFMREKLINRFKELISQVDKIEKEWR